MVAGLLKGSQIAGKFKDFMPLLRSSMPGALFSGGFATLTTGNPLAGLTVAGADLLGSTALATGIGTLGKKKILGKNINFEGGEVTKLRPDEVIPKEARTSKEAFEKFIQRRTSFEPSPAQTVGQIAGSIGAVLAVEPMFYPKTQDSIVQQQLRQRLGYSQTLPNDELGLGETGGQLTANLSPGTLYQMAGNPMRGA